MNDWKLSPAGENRRQEIRAEVQQRLSRIHRLRRLRNRGILFTAAVLLISLSLPQLAWNPPSSIVRNGGVVRPEAMDPPMFQIVASDGQPADSKSASRLQLEIIDDETLLQLMDEVGQPSFFGRIDGKQVLIRKSRLSGEFQ